MPITNNSQENTLLVTVLPGVPSNNTLIYALGGGAAFPDLQADEITPALWYHGGYPAIDVTVKTTDCDNTLFSSQNNEVVSPEFKSGIITEADSEDFWDECYTTPLGLFRNINLGTPDRFQFVFNSLYEFVINVSDINIIPSVNDFIVIQRFHEGEFTFPNPVTGNISPSQSYTDGILNLPVYKTETYVFQITGVVTGSTASEWVITIDKSFIPLDSGYYTMVLLNREATLNNRELFLNTWQQIEVHQQQLLGDLYDYAGFLRPRGAKNFLNYEGSEYLGMGNKLGVNQDFIILDFEDNIEDHLFYENDSIQIKLPVLLVNDVLDVIVTNSGYVDGENGYKGDLLLVETGEKIGTVFYNLRIMIITDSEIVAAMSYNSNRNYTLPKPALEQGNTSQVLTPQGNNIVVQPYEYFLTYRIKNVHYDTLPYAEKQGFNWDVNEQVKINIPQLSWLKTDSQPIGFEATDYEVIIGKYIIDVTNVLLPVITGTEDIVIMPLLDVLGNPTELITLGTQNTHNAVYTKTMYDNQVIANAFYDLTTMYGINTPEDLLVGKNNWLLGVVSYRSFTNQYRMQIDYKLLAGKWNGTLNPTFDCSDEFQQGKLITEVGLRSHDSEVPCIYAKISPPILKTNLNDLLVSLIMDF